MQFIPSPQPRVSGRKDRFLTNYRTRVSQDILPDCESKGQPRSVKGNVKHENKYQDYGIK